jgi:hypothetical protein
MRPAPVYMCCVLHFSRLSFTAVSLASPRAFASKSMVVAAAETACDPYGLEVSAPHRGKAHDSAGEEGDRFGCQLVGAVWIRVKIDLSRSGAGWTTALASSRGDHRRQQVQRRGGVVEERPAPALRCPKRGVNRRPRELGARWHDAGSSSLGCRGQGARSPRPK